MGLMMKRFEIDFYELPNGLRPVEEFLNSLEVKMRVKAINSLEILEEHGNMLREPYSKPIENGIFELRIQFANDISRIFYFFVTGRKIVLTNGFIKKTNKSPKNDIGLALRYKEDYERRYRSE